MTGVLIGSALMEAGRGGIARLARISALALQNRGIDVAAVTYLDEAPPDIPGIRARTARGNKLAFTALCHREALRADAMLFDFAGVARGRPRLPGFRRPYAVFMCGIEAWEALRPSAEAAYREADLVLAISQYTLDRYERLHGTLPNARICWLATERGDAPPPRGPAAGRPPRALILGRIDKSLQYKGHYELIDAWPRVLARVPDARLVVAGGGNDLENVRAAAAASPAAGQIDVLGFVPEAEMEELWTGVDVFTMPCRGGGFGFVYVEAMRHSLPVVASIEDAAPEINIEGVTGFNVAIADVEALADRLARLLENQPLAQAMGAAGFDRWRTHFRPVHFEDRLVGLLTDGGLLGPADRVRRPA